MQYQSVILALFATAGSLVYAMPIDSSGEVALSNPGFDARDIASEIDARDFDDGHLVARGKAFSKSSSPSKGSKPPKEAKPPKNEKGFTEDITECLRKCRGLPEKEAAPCRHNCYYNQKGNSYDSYSKFSDAAGKKSSH